MTNDDFKQAALEYHRQSPPGKIKVAPTKPMLTQRDLALAYSPGVAYACEAIVDNPTSASELTARGNLVAVVTNGTAVLGLGNIGPLAGKPVMEGKGVLFQKFAGIDVFDIEIDETDPDKLVDIIASLEPTFGGINLEDIKAPECFIVERKLRERMNIPVFHDDQHGTAIIVGAAVVNALEVVGKKIGEVKLATSGAGAAGIACLDMLVALGLKPENILAFDRDGVIHTGRPNLDPDKARYARDTGKRSLAEIVEGADIFLGLSAGGILKPEMVATMADKPIILALANPNPEISPADAKAVRPDAIIGTGRSDYPNQVNNALCFPYIFRGALDVGATVINEAMKVACVHAIANLARREASDLGSAYGDDVPCFGPEYLIPRPFDPRLLVEVAAAVAQAAMDSGVALRPIADMWAYREKLGQFVYRTSLMMKPVYDRARADIKLTVTEFIGVKLLAALVGAGVGAAAGRAAPEALVLAALVGAILFSFIPNIYIGYAAGERVKKFNNQLGDTITMMANALRSGSSFLQTLDLVSREAPNPTSTEFRRVVQEVSLGLTTEEALQNLLKRVPSDDLDLLITAVGIQMESGGNLAQILDTIGHTIRERVRIKGDIAVLTAQGRISAYVITALPIGLAIFISVINPEYMKPMFTFGFPPDAWCCLPVAALTMIIIGFFAIMKIVDIEV